MTPTPQAEGREAASGMRRYIFKLYPTPAQAAILHEQRKMMADLWNALKERREAVYSREHKTLTFFDLTNEITDLRHQCPEWAIVPAITAHRVAKHLTDAYAAFLRRVKSGEAPGYPRWQKREAATTIPLGTMDKTGWHVEKHEDNPFSWRLHYKSVTEVKNRATWIHARGRMPARRDSEISNAPVLWPGQLKTGSITPAWRRRRAENGITPLSWRNADIIWRNNRWWLSVCVEIESRRAVGRHPVTVSFNLIDELAKVNGIAETPDELIDAMVIQADIDRLKSERDIRWPRGRKWSDAERAELAEANAEISSLSAFVARKRRNALHVWSSRIVSRASDLTIIAPPMRETVKTPRGDAKRWGANIRPVSELNRHVLSQAPATAIAMLRYKAAEAGIRCDVVTDDAPNIGVGPDLVKAGQQLRRARRQLSRYEGRRAA